MPSLQSYEPDIMPGQSIWLWNDRLGKGMNGIISWIDYDNRIINCSFYDNGTRQIDYDELASNWDDKLQQWVIIPL